MNLFNNGTKPSKIDRIIARSAHAICGPNEREVLVKNAEVSSTKRLLRQRGFTIVGTGKRGASTVIWFNPIGGF